ncbi:glutamate-rich protein 6B isoform X2 [Ambystoma mexicanum]
MSPFCNTPVCIKLTRLCELQAKSQKTESAESEGECKILPLLNVAIAQVLLKDDSAASRENEGVNAQTQTDWHRRGKHELSSGYGSDLSRKLKVQDVKLFDSESPGKISESKHRDSSVLPDQSTPSMFRSADGFLKTGHKEPQKQGFNVFTPDEGFHKSSEAHREVLRSLNKPDGKRVFKIFAPDEEIHKSSETHREELRAPNNPDGKHVFKIFAPDEEIHKSSETHREELRTPNNPDGKHSIDKNEGIDLNKPICGFCQPVTTCVPAIQQFCAEQLTSHLVTNTVSTENSQICVFCNQVSKIFPSLDQFLAEAKQTNAESHEKVTEDEQICDFCYQVIKPFPTMEQIRTQPLDTLFCCHMYQVLMRDVIKSTMSPQGNVEIFNPQPPAHKSMQLLIKQAVENSFRLKGGHEHLAALAKKLNMDQSIHATTTDSVQLSDNRVIEDSRDLGALSPHPSLEETPEEVDRVDLFISTNELEAEHVKKCQSRVNKFYRNGKIFNLIFPDGTGQVLYPSGNVAILITRTEPIAFTFIILEDDYIKPNIRAIFKSNGQSTCYRPNGSLWVNLDPSGGTLFTKNGTQLKHWSWQDAESHIHAPPFQPINVQVNPRIEIRISSQDQIQLTFSTKRTGIKFNVGAKLRLKDPKETYKVRMNKDEKFLHQKSLLIHSLFAKIKYELRSSKGYGTENIQCGSTFDELLCEGTAAPQAKKSSSDSPQDQQRGRQMPQVAASKAIKARDSSSKPKIKDSLQVQGSIRRPSTAIPTSKLAKVQYH